MHLDVAPGGQDAQRHDQGGHEHQEQTDAIHADGVLDFERRNPRKSLPELKLSRTGVETEIERQRENGGDSGESEGPPTNQVFALDHHHRSGGQKRAEDQHA